MDFRDKIFWDIRRGRIPPPGLDLIRMDRAILYAKKQIQAHIEYISGKSTKTIGDYAYRLDRFRSEMFSIFSMGRDNFLLEKISTAFRGLHTRTLREDAIKRLREIDALLESYEAAEAAEDVDVLREQVAELQTRLLTDSDQQAAVADVGDQRVVFVIMPFSTAFNDVWKGAIEKASKELNLRPIRVDMINRSSNITDDIVESIKNCHLAIVDVSENNPNVMFELGYALALGKPNIIISQSANFLPFDIRSIRSIVYTNSWSGIEELRSKIKDFLREAGPAMEKIKRGKKAKPSKLNGSHEHA